MTEAEILEVERWAKAHAGAGSRTAKLVLTLLARYREETVAHAKLRAVWDAAVRTYPEGVPMPPALRDWWRAIYERVTGQEPRA